MTAQICTPLEGLHEAAQAIFLHALEECSIEAAFDRHLHFEGDVLIRHVSPLLPPSRIELNKFKSILVIAIGKAARPLMETLLSRMPRRKGVRGICCAPEIPRKRNWRIRYFAGGHPLPNKSSFDAARAALHMLHRARKDTFIFFLISGGGSAMFELPLDPAISLEDTMAFHEALISSGAAIAEVNTVRKHFSAVKGGRLAMAAPDSTKLSLLLPDVPLRHMDALASSPTLPDRTTVEQTREILQRYHLLEKFPQSVRFFFQREDLPETPGAKVAHAWTSRPLEAGAARTSIFANSTAADPFGAGSIGFDTLLSGHDLVNAARDHARSLGFKVVIDNTCDEWDYADAARYLLERFHALRQEHPRLCLISGGEVTVRIDGPAGTGGRNQQFALACALDLAKWEGDPLVVFSAGSDGIDGNSQAAGAIADTTTVSRARAFGFDPQESLAQFNACPLFTALGDTVVTGPTAHNLRDLRLLLAVPRG
ncbi:MAG TPA: DUF4147 domain-containing protein [Acidisarcina sp.]|nr:DUF4147 domain-containing protein [Acidisarcina sp.]